MATRFATVLEDEIRKINDLAIPFNTKKVTGISVFTDRMKTVVLRNLKIKYNNKNNKVIVGKKIRSKMEIILRQITYFICQSFFSEWFLNQTEFTTPFEDMEPAELAK